MRFFGRIYEQTEKRDQSRRYRYAVLRVRYPVVLFHASDHADRDRERRHRRCGADLFFLQVRCSTYENSDHALPAPAKAPAQALDGNKKEKR